MVNMDSALRFPASANLSLRLSLFSRVSICLAYVLMSLLGASRQVSSFIETQLTPLPSMVKVTAGVPQYIASARATPNASFLVIEGNANTLAAYS